MADGTFALDAQFLRKLAATVAGHPKPGPYLMIGIKVGGHETLDLAGEGQPNVFRDNEAQSMQQQAEQRLGQLRKEMPDAEYAILGPFISPGLIGKGGYDIQIETVQTAREGQVLNWEVPSGTDMLCWTASAFEKFVAPYYYMLYGSSNEASENVDKLRSAMEDVNGSGILAHRWPTSSGILGGKTFEILKPKQPSA